MDKTPEPDKTYVMYHIADPGQRDRERLNAVVDAAQSLGLDVSSDARVATDLGWQPIPVVELRSAIIDRNQRSALAALVTGAWRAAAGEQDALMPELNTRRNEPGRVTRPARMADNIAIGRRARQLIEEFQHDPLHDDFMAFAGGLQWSDDQERLLQALFERSADFDPDQVRNLLTPSNLWQIASKVGLDLPYEQRRRWLDAPVEQTLTEHPEIDYRRLADPSFAGTDEGKTLSSAYAELSGYETFSHYQDMRRSGERPVLPLSRYPIVAGFFEDAVRRVSPEMKWALGPADAVQLVLNSDNISAIRGIFDNINTRTPPGFRHVSDGPSEFQVKRSLVRDVIDSYSQAQDPTVRDELRQGLLTVLNVYTTGAVAQDVLRENRESLVAGGGWDRIELSEVREIVSNLIRDFITSPDKELASAAFQKIREFGLNSDSAEPSVRLSPSSMKVMLLDAVDKIGVGSSTRLIGTLGTTLFGSEVVGRELEQIAQQRRHAEVTLKAKHVDVARRALAERPLALDNSKAKVDPDRARYTRLSARADKLYEAASRRKTALILGLLGNMAATNDLQSSEQRRLADNLIERVHLREKASTQEYKALLAIGNNPNTPDDTKAKIAWRVAEQFKYVDSAVAKQLGSVALDLIQMLLGPVESVGVITEGTGSGLSAVSWLVREQGSAIFRAATPQLLQTFEAYKDVVDHMVAVNPVSGSTQRDREEKSHYEWAARDLHSIAETYAKFVHTETVKADPSVYYQWMLEQFLPFWYGMQWEVGPGNRPSPDVARLYRQLESDVTSLLSIQDKYPADFDPIADGHVDQFLRHAHDHMVPNHDIGYNSTVWQKGLPFLRYAVAMMPESLARQVMALHRGTSFAEYVGKVRGVEAPAAQVVQ